MKKLSLKLRSLAFVFIAGIGAGIVSSTVAQNFFFPDVAIDAYYHQAIQDAAALGLITGYSDGTFKPDEPLSRGQAAVIFMRFAEKVGLDVSHTTVQSSSARSARSTRTRSSAVTEGQSSSSAESIAERVVNDYGLFRFTTSSFKVDEDDGKARITIVRTSGNKGVVKVEYTLEDGTANVVDDYEALSGTLEFDDGETSKTIEVTIVDDSEQEENETITLKLQNAEGGAGFSEPKVATLTILDDDTGSGGSTTTEEGPDAGTFNYSATEYTVLEDSGTLTVTVERVKSKGAVSVQYTTSDGSGKEGSDYTKASGTLTFEDGDTEKTFEVIFDDNSSIDGNKTVNLSLTSPTGGAILGANQKSVITISDDDTGVAFGTGSFKFSKIAYDVLESEGEVVITIKRIGGTKGEATVQYETINGTAHSGSDYTETEGTMVFKNGEAAKTFVIPVTKDATNDSGETVNIRIKDPSNGAGLVSPSNASLTIY